MRTLLTVFVVLALAAFAALGIAIVRTHGAAQTVSSGSPSAAISAGHAGLLSSAARKKQHEARSCQANPPGHAPLANSGSATVLHKVSPVACEQPPRSEVNVSGLNTAANTAIALNG